LPASIGVASPVRRAATPVVSVKRKIRRIAHSVAIADLSVMVLSLFVAWHLRDNVNIWSKPLVHQDRWITDCSWIPVPWLAVLAARGAYSARNFGGGPEEFKVVLTGSVSTACMVGMACYLLSDNLSRGFVLISFALGIPLLIIERFAIRKVIQRMRRTGRLVHRVLAVGGPDAVAEVVEVLHRERRVGYEVVGACLPQEIGIGEWSDCVPVVGRVDDVKAACVAVGADTVLVTGGSFSSSAALRRVGWQLEGTNVDLVVVPSLADIAGPRIHLRPVAGLPLMHVEPPQADEAGRWSKRLFDICGALAGIVVAAPVMALAAVAIKLEDGGPILFRQPRVGRGGFTFECLKLRSMSVDAEARLADLLHHNESDGLLFKMRADPRVTRIGAFLRRFSLDEMPQLLNVLRGHMSLVGPRPPLPSEVDLYTEDVRRRLLVRPGMTGLWQVSGRSQLSWRESVRLDLYYVDNWSMVEDLIILTKTFRAVAGSSGAY
jgi:exopolysaccharide biosynthesis polyprenyl glycosylphosphotransferase